MMVKKFEKIFRYIFINIDFLLYLLLFFFYLLYFIENKCEKFSIFILVVWAFIVWVVLELFVERVF